MVFITFIIRKHSLKKNNFFKNERVGSGEKELGWNRLFASVTSNLLESGCARWKPGKAQGKPILLSFPSFSLLVWFVRWTVVQVSNLHREDYECIFLTWWDRRSVKGGKGKENGHWWVGEAVTLGEPFQWNTMWMSVISKTGEDETWSLPSKRVTVYCSVLQPPALPVPDGQKGFNQHPLNERIRCPLMKRCSTSF